MRPIVLIHGYGSDRNTRVEDIYGTLPSHLRDHFGTDNLVEIDLARWISLNDGISIDDISFALNRALHSRPYRGLLDTGFHVVIHSTGALVVRNWIRLFSPKPSPIGNLVHLAGANFGSGLAHVAVGKLAWWAQLIFKGVGRGVKVLSELEFGSSKILDLHGHFLTPGNDMYDDYQVQEFCIIGSQTLRALHAVPIRYVKEDSADNTVRTAACNLNFNYVKAEPQSDAQRIHHTRLGQLLQSRRDNKRLNEVRYALDFRGLAATRREVPYTVLYETAHFGTD